MKILKQEKDGNKVRVEVEVDHGRLDASIKKVYAQASRDLTVPGFRKGKVPAEIAATYLNADTIRERAVQDLISEVYPDLIDEANILPVDYPSITVLSQKEGEPLRFAMEVDVYPSVKLGKYKGLSVDSESSEVSEEEVDKFVENIRQSVANFIDVEGRPAEHGDMVELDIQASGEAGPLEAFSSRSARMEIGQGSITADFDSNIIGLGLGQEKKFSIRMPEHHIAKDIAGREVTFTVKAKRIMKKELPEVNDEFANNVSNLPTVDALREDLRKRMGENKKARIDADMKNALLEQVVKGISADVPEGMVRRETDMMVEDLRATLLRDKLTLDQYLKLTKRSEQDVRNEMRNGALARVRSRLALKAIADAEKIELSGEDIGGEINSLARSGGEKPEKFAERIGESGLEYIKDYLVRRKALDLVVSNAKVTVKK